MSRERRWNIGSGFNAPDHHGSRNGDQILREHSPAKVLAILTQDTEEGNRLRQSDPFCGILTEEERLRFFG
jgi:hypothetical protein